MYCEKCKKIYSSDENFCADCGSKLVDELDVYARELLNKDEAAFDKIYDNTKTWVSRYVSMHLANQEDCMDCTQEIYFKLFNKIELFHPENGKFRSWFNTLVKNQVIDFARKNSKEVLVEDEEVFEGIVDPEPIAEIEMDRKESSRLLNEILDTLPEEQKQCITGFYFEGRKRKEIAEILGLSEDTIKSRLRLAKQKIEEKVLELERVQGTRLYGLSPFAFFLFLGANERTKGLNFVLLQGRILKQKAIAEQISKDAGTLNGVEETTIEGTKMSVGEAATTVGKATVATAGKSAFMKTMIAIVATAVIGGGSFLGYTIYQKQHKEPKQETIAVQEIDKELEELLNNIDMEYLEGALLLLPEFTEKERVSDSQICDMAYVAGVAKYFNEYVNRDFYKIGNVVRDQDVVKIISNEEMEENQYEYGYVLLEGEAFVPIFEMLGKTYKENILLNSESRFVKDEDNIKVLTDAIIEPGREYKIKEIRTEADSKKKRIVMEYTREEAIYVGSLSEQELEYKEEKYCAVLSPSDNALGYVIESNTVKEKDTSEIQGHEEEIYAETLEKYRTGMKENWSMEEFLGAGLSDCCEGENRLGYSILDINGDGQKELFIGKIGADSGEVFDAYTISNGQPVLLVQSKFRYMYYLTAEFNICCLNFGANTYDYYYVEKNNTELQLVESISYGENMDGESSWMHSDKEKLYPGVSTQYDLITEEQAKKIQEKYSERYKFDFKPILETESETGNKMESSLKKSEMENVAKVEEESERLEQNLSDTAIQSEMNEYSGQYYKLWDDELNRLWKVLKNELNDETMKSVLEEQRQWIKEKETAVSEAKALVSGGSAEIMNANMTGGELTRSRVYELLEYLP